MFTERVSFIIWLTDVRQARNLDKYGTVYYVSRRMKYAQIYMNADRAPEVIRNMQRLKYVRKIERSYRGELKTEFETLQRPEKVQEIIQKEKAYVAPVEEV